MPLEDNVKLFVTPLLEPELTASPTHHQLEEWRRRTQSTADPSTVLGALLTKFDGLSVDHSGVRATLHWFGSSVHAGEKCLFVLMELVTPDARGAVLALDRGFERRLGAPVSPHAVARLEELLRRSIEVSLVDGALPEAYFFGTACEFLQSVPVHLAAEPPAESVGRWILDHGIPAICAEACEIPLARGRHLTLSIRRDESDLQPSKDGIWFAPILQMRRTGARKKVLGEVEQQLCLGLVGADAMFAPLPVIARRDAALRALPRWRATLVRRIGKLPISELPSLMPMDLPWPTSPLDLMIRALGEGRASRREG